MRRLNERDLSHLKFKERKAPRTSKVSAVYRELDMLVPGQALLVEKKDWTIKSGPSQSQMPAFCRTMGRRYTVRTLQDDNGFVIIRTV